MAPHSPLIYVIYMLYVMGVSGFSQRVWTLCHDSGYQSIHQRQSYNSGAQGDQAFSISYRLTTTSLVVVVRSTTVC